MWYCYDLLSKCHRLIIRRRRSSTCSCAAAVGTPFSQQGTTWTLHRRKCCGKGGKQGGQHQEKVNFFVVQKWMIRCFLQSFRNQRQTFLDVSVSCFFVWSGGARAPFLTRSSNAPCVVQAKFLGSFVYARGLCATTWLSSKQGSLAGGMMNDQMVSFRRS